MSWKACELVWQRGWRCTISASGSTIGSAVPVWPLPICWDGDLNSHQAFKGHKELQNEERLLSGTLWHDNDLVFPSRIGTPMNAKNLTARSFKPLLRSAGLPDIRLHDLRHPRHLQPRAPGDGRSDNHGYGERAILAGCSTVAVISPGERAGANLYQQVLPANLAFL